MTSAAETPGDHAAIGAWRQGVQRAMLNVAAFVAPPIVVATVALRWGSWTLVDTGVISGVGLVVLLCCIAADRSPPARGCCLSPRSQWVCTSSAGTGSQAV
jgi:hypothetical protein